MSGVTVGEIHSSSAAVEVGGVGDGGLIKQEIKQETALQLTPAEEAVVHTEEVVTAASQLQPHQLQPHHQAAIVEGEDGEQQIYIIQADGDAIPVVEGAEVVVSGGGGDGSDVANITPTTPPASLVETVSALEQLSRSSASGAGPGIVQTDAGDFLQVYEEVVLPDGTSAKLEDEAGGGSNMVGNLTLPTAPVPTSTLTNTLAAAALASAASAASATSTGSGSSQQIHTDPTTGQEFHICRICNQFVTAEMLPTHNAQAHGHIRDLTCMDCGKLFKSKRSLFGHRKEKHSGMLEVHSCPECGKSFGRKSNLKAHRESLHYGKKFPCVYCERIFTNRSSMNQHIKKTHSNGGGNVNSVAALSSVNSVVQQHSANNGQQQQLQQQQQEQTVIWHPQTTVINI